MRASACTAGADRCSHKSASLTSRLDGASMRPVIRVSRVRNLVSHSCNGPSRWPSSTRKRVSWAGPEVPLAAGTSRRRRRECVDDQPTAVAGVVIALVGIRLCLDRTVHADGVGDPLLFSPTCRRSQSPCPVRPHKSHTRPASVAHSSASPAPWAAVHPSWKTASCSSDSNAILLGSYTRMRWSTTGVTVPASRRPRTI